MLREQARHGMKVYFGRDNGEKTLGEIVKINPLKAKVKILEDRGNGRGSEIGSVWGVPYEMMTPADASAQSSPPPAPAKREPLTYNPFQPYEDVCMLEAIATIYGHLSPENLACDGLATVTHMRRVQAECNRKLKGLFAALGREVNESEVYAWEESKRKCEQERKEA